ncbi:hypothetical protein [Burkholderia sp. LMG 13014]|uniref:hypothetical protein n=1 Tax=Burkholderia sp. LMG 13014 TaxID=2709306 RepID=UPI0019646904|nr:hypothetical protein [Burkholderia sp. LMG 13014]
MTTIVRKFDNLDAFHPDFRAVVLAHIPTLPAGEWERLRTIGAESPDRPALPRGTPLFAIDTQADMLVDSCVGEDSTSVEDVLSTGLGASAVTIGEIAGEPVWYIEGEGVYLWGPARIGEFSLSFWATYPAYPPSW